MTQEEKDLLLVDLCARLLYGVKVRINTKNNYYTAIVCEITRNYICVEGGGEICFSHGTYKTYLRPMSSMTEEEKDFYDSMFIEVEGDYFSMFPTAIIDWLNSNHFDYRGLIEKGIALEAPKDMYSKQ